VGKGFASRREGGSRERKRDRKSAVEKTHCYEVLISPFSMKAQKELREELKQGKHKKVEGLKEVGYGGGNANSVL